jgi:hypothetical protein
MNSQCFNEGCCIICGCDCTALQMANKACDGKEYPPILPYFKWRAYSKGKTTVVRGDYAWVYSPISKKTFIYRVSARGTYYHVDTRCTRKDTIPSRHGTETITFTKAYHV